MPLLVAAVAFAELDEAPTFEGEVLVDLVEELLVAGVVGVAVAVVVATLSKASVRRHWVQDGWALVIPLVATVVAYAATVELGGSGFIASFVAGLTYGRLLGPSALGACELTEELGGLLSAVSFLLFGAVLLGRGFSDLDARTVLYAIASLTVVRMIPVALSLLGSGARWPTMIFAGWFGPRGLATIVFALTVVEESGLTGTRRIVDVATVTVAFSVFAHGLTAPALTDRYVRWFTANEGTLTLETDEVRVRYHGRMPRPAWLRRGASGTDDSTGANEP